MVKPQVMVIIRLLVQDINNMHALQCLFLRNCRFLQMCIFVFFCIVCNDVLCDDFYVKIANNKSAVQYSVSVQSGISGSNIYLQANSNKNYFSSIFKKTSSTWEVSKDASQGNINNLPANVEWAGYSPDGRYVLYGLKQEPWLDRRAAVLMRVMDHKALYSFDGNNYDEVYLKDFLWAKDSSYIVLLLSRTRLKKTPIGMFAALTGHGIPLYKYSLEIISVDDVIGNKKIDIPSEFERAVAGLDYTSW